MFEEIEELLAAKYPIYSRLMEYPSCFYEYGFECGAGWLPLFCNFAEEVNKLDIEDLRIMQIKEKCYRLIIYTEAKGVDAYKVDELEDILECESSKVCECCGEPKNDGHKCHERWKSKEAMILWAREIINNR